MGLWSQCPFQEQAPKDLRAFCCARPQSLKVPQPVSVSVTLSSEPSVHGSLGHSTLTTSMIKISKVVPAPLPVYSLFSASWAGVEM